NYKSWMRYGGVETLQGYLQRYGKKAEKSNFQDPYSDNTGVIYNPEELMNPYSLARQRIKDFVPQEHKDFINSCDLYHETDDFIFVHGGCDPLKPMSEQSQEHLIWDRSLYRSVADGK